MIHNHYQERISCLNKMSSPVNITAIFEFPDVSPLLAVNMSDLRMFSALVVSVSAKPDQYSLSAVKIRLYFLIFCQDCQSCLANAWAIWVAIKTYTV